MGRNRGGLSRIKDGRIATLTQRKRTPLRSGPLDERDRQATLSGCITSCGLVQLARSELGLWAENPTATVKTTTFDSSSGVRFPVTCLWIRPRVAEASDGKFWFVRDEGVSIHRPPPSRFQQSSPAGRD